MVGSAPDTEKTELELPLLITVCKRNLQEELARNILLEEVMNRTRMH